MLAIQEFAQGCDAAFDAILFGDICDAFATRPDFAIILKALKVLFARANSVAFVCVHQRHVFSLTFGVICDFRQNAFQFCELCFGH